MDRGKQISSLAGTYFDLIWVDDQQEFVRPSIKKIQRSSRLRKFIEGGSQLTSLRFENPVELIDYLRINPRLVCNWCFLDLWYDDDESILTTLPEIRHHYGIRKIAVVTVSDLELMGPRQAVSEGELFAAGADCVINKSIIARQDFETPLLSVLSAGQAHRVAIDHLVDKSLHQGELSNEDLFRSFAETLDECVNILLDDVAKIRMKNRLVDAGYCRALLATAAVNRRNILKGTKLAEAKLFSGVRSSINANESHEMPNIPSLGNGPTTASELPTATYIAMLVAAVGSLVLFVGSSLIASDAMMRLASLAVLLSAVAGMIVVRALYFEPVDDRD